MNERTPLLDDSRKAVRWWLVGLTLGVCLVVIAAMGLSFYGISYYDRQPYINYISGKCLVMNCSYQPDEVTVFLQPVGYENLALRDLLQTKSSSFCLRRTGNRTCYFNPVDPTTYCSLRQPNNFAIEIIGLLIVAIVMLGLCLFTFALLINGSTIEQTGQTLVDRLFCPFDSSEIN